MTNRTIKLMRTLGVALLCWGMTPALPVLAEVSPVSEPAEAMVSADATRNDKKPRILRRVGVEPDSALVNSRVVIGKDTVSIIIPQRNLGRYDRGLYNYLFIPKGQWQFGLTASYGEFNADDMQILSVLKDFDFDGKQYSVKPYISYFIRNNQSLGIKMAYTRADAHLGSLKMDISDDLNLSISGVSYNSTLYSIGVLYRSYVGLGTMKRFAVFNDVDLSFTSGSSRFIRNYAGEPRDTKTVTSEVSLNFSPGVCVFVMDNVNFNVSFGVFGVRLKNEHQTTNLVDEGSRFSSGANFRFNIFNINFGLGVNI